MSTGGEHTDPKKVDLDEAISFELSRAFANYPTTVENARRAANELARLHEIIEMINAGMLPKGRMVMTRSVSGMPVSLTPAKFLEINPTPPFRGSIVYRPDENGEYRPDGEFATVGMSGIFLGDRLLVTEDDNLVVINSELGVGITTSREVTIVNVSGEGAGEDGASLMRRYTHLMEMVDEVRDGKTEAFDCLYY